MFGLLVCHLVNLACRSPLFSERFERKFILREKSTATLHGIEALKSAIAQEQEAAHLVGCGVDECLRRIVAAVA